MLEVHPAPHAANTWRDFFIHIATIVLGLLIAIGLEQTVELLHRHHQAHQMEQALRDESIENRTVIEHDLAAVAESRRVVELNMGTLDRAGIRGGKEGFVPIPFGPEALFATTDTAWLTLRDNGLLSIIPGRIADNYWKVDFMCQRVISDMEVIRERRGRVNAFLHLHSDPSSLSAEERAALLLAYSEMDQAMVHMHSMLLYFNDNNEKALAGQTLSVDLAAGGLDKTSAK